MQDFSVTDANITDLLAVVATGESVRLLKEGQAVAVVSPPEGSEAPQDQGEVGGGDEVDRSPGWIMRIREKYEFDKYGVTKEEVDSWRDRSPGREPLTFE